MKRLLNYLPFHFVGLLFLGITLQFYDQIWEFGFLKLLLSIVIISLVLIGIKHKKIITVLSFVLFFLIGISAVYFNNDANYKNYYQNYEVENATVILKVDKVLKPGIYHHKYVVEIIQTNSVKTRGKVLLNIKKDSLVNRLKVDELLLTKTDFKEINSPLNPHQFNYKKYLAKQGIHQQLFLENNQFKKVGFDVFSLKGISAKFRNYVEESLKKYNFKADELAVINALLLGQRQDISKELVSDYSRAGAIHILAISGLHVGIILLILNWLFKPIERLKKGKFIKIVLVVLFLWMFAFVAGLSASVVRAVTMFTFLSIGLSFRRKNIIEFSLISSMFLLLIVKPMFLFDVGFQLSYLAVFGIIWIQPKLSKIYNSRFIVDKKMWELITVSVAAQAGILPLSLFYFHQFPSLFLLSNLIIIPFLGAILIGGIVIIFLSLIGLLPQFFASIYGFIISLMNNFVNWISHQEQFLLKEISVSLLMMIASYIFIILGTRFFMDRSAKRLVYLLISIIIVQSVFVIEVYQKKNKNEFIIFHKNKNSVFGIRDGRQLLVHHDLGSLEIKNSNMMASYRIGEDVHQVFKTNHSNVFQLDEKSILLVDSLGIYQLKNLKNPVVVLQYSPKINLSRLIQMIKPSQIIADGSNYKSYVKRWGSTCKKQKTPFYFTGIKGAYIISE